MSRAEYSPAIVNLKNNTEHTLAHRVAYYSATLKLFESTRAFPQEICNFLILWIRLDPHFHPQALAGAGAGVQQPFL